MYYCCYYSWIFILLSTRSVYEYNLCSRRTFSLQMRTGQQVSDLTENLDVTVPIAFAAKVNLPRNHRYIDFAMFFLQPAVKY